MEKIHKIFKGKTAIVTGAASGIGQQLAIALGNFGCNLALVDISPTGLSQTYDLINSTVRCSLHVVDLTDLESIRQLETAVKSIHTHIDFLFNIAGIAHGGKFWEMHDETVEKVISTNFLSVAYMTKIFLSGMMQERKGHIINMSSSLGLFVLEKQSMYVASKFAIKGFSKALMCELKGSGIDMTIVYPGAVSTNIVKNSIAPQILSKKKPQYSTISKGMDAKNAALTILKGVAHKKHEIIIGNDAKLGYALSILFPNSYADIIKRFTDM